MKFNKIILAIAFIFTAKAYSQTTTVQKISLAQAFEIGLKSRYDAQANKVDIALANNTVSKSKKEWLPDIYATGSVRYNTQLQTMVLDGFGAGNQVGGPNQKITLGTTNLTYLSFDLTQNIYKPGLNTDIKIAENNALLEEEKNKEKDISIRQTIAEAYFNALLREVQLKLATENLERNSKYYTVAQDKYNLKVLLDNDLLKTKLDYENAKLAALEAKNNYDLSLIQLKYRINMDNVTGIALADSLESFQKMDADSNPSVITRTELKQLSIQQEANKLYLSKSRLYFIPTVSLIGNYTTQFQSANFDYSKNLWSPYNYIALKISLPLTGNFKNANTIHEYHLRIRQNELQVKQKQLDIDYEVNRYKAELANAEVSAKTSKNNLELAKTVYENQMKLYRLGTVTYAGMLDTETSINTAEQNYVKAVYNYLVAKVNYEKSIGAL